MLSWWSSHSLHPVRQWLLREVLCYWSPTTSKWIWSSIEAFGQRFPSFSLEVYQFFAVWGCIFRRVVIDEQPIHCLTSFFDSDTVTLHSCLSSLVLLGGHVQSISYYACVWRDLTFFPFRWWKILDPRFYVSSLIHHQWDQAFESSSNVHLICLACR